MADRIYCYPNSDVLINKLSFSKIKDEDMIRASKKSFLCDYGEMERLFTECIQKKIEKN